METLDCLETLIGEDKPAPESKGTAYESCAKVAAAGEARVHGSCEDVKGFPEETVPSARDGGGDEPICERATPIFCYEREAR